MSKWKLFATNSIEAGNMETKEQRIRREQRFANAIRKLSSPSYEELTKESDNAAIQKEIKDAALIKAYDKKKLKSKALIKQARAIKKQRAAKNKEVEAVATV